MKCTQCGLYRETVAEIRSCARCQDGTAQQIPALLDDKERIVVAIALRAGLANRFIPGSDQAIEVAHVEEPKPTFVGRVKRALGRK